MVTSDDIRMLLVAGVKDPKRIFLAGIPEEELAELPLKTKGLKWYKGYHNSGFHHGERSLDKKPSSKNSDTLTCAAYSMIHAAFTFVSMDDIYTAREDFGLAVEYISAAGDMNLAEQIHNIAEYYYPLPKEEKPSTISRCPIEGESAAAIFANLDYIVLQRHTRIDDSTRLEALLMVGQGLYLDNDIPPEFVESAREAGQRFYDDERNITSALCLALAAFAERGKKCAERLGIAFNALTETYGELFPPEHDEQLLPLKTAMKKAQIEELRNYVSNLLDLDYKEQQKLKGERKFLGYEALIMAAVLEETRKNYGRAILMYNKALERTREGSEQYDAIFSRLENLHSMIHPVRKPAYEGEHLRQKARIEGSDAMSRLPASEYEVLRVVSQLLPKGDEFGIEILAQETSKYIEGARDNPDFRRYVIDRISDPCVGNLRTRRENTNQGYFAFEYLAA